MEWRDIALDVAGLIGGGTAIVHGVLTQRLMVRPFEAAFAGDRRMAASIRRIVPLLLHFSTVAWLLGGVALIAAANGLAADARLATCLCVGALYLFGALGNLWATRGRHPGWMLLAASLGLIAMGVA